ncbi:hypothetical protein BH23GEM3_BH23GEM3_25720 [soil metagenome]
MTHNLPHAADRLPLWTTAWRRSGRLVLLLDFDGTLAPIVERPELARPLPAAVQALGRLQQRNDLDIAVVSGRGLADARALAGLEGIAYAGNHGMEIDGPGVHQIHTEAAAARPQLERVADALRRRLGLIEGAIVEDKGLTLSIHFRLVAEGAHPEVRAAVTDAVATASGLHVTEGKMVLEIRPQVDWHKGRAVEFLLRHLSPPTGAPVLYFGDDTTDEDAFRALSSWSAGEGVIVGEERLESTAACSFVRSPDEVADVLATLADVE